MQPGHILQSKSHGFLPTIQLRGFHEPSNGMCASWHQKQKIFRPDNRKYKRLYRAVHSGKENVTARFDQLFAGCGHFCYPRISPAVIVGILNGDRLLLAHNRRFPRKRYSVIAGYVEVGETLEDCVRREIREEVGIEVKVLLFSPEFSPGQRQDDPPAT